MDTVIEPAPRKHRPTSTVGRGKRVKEVHRIVDESWSQNGISVQLGDSLKLYENWEPPTAIISDGGYGVLGFEGDTSDHLELPQWYEEHAKKWAELSSPETTLWFWNSEIGWAAVHPILEKYGWRYINANIWDKGKGHIAGNVNTAKIRRFPVVTEVCVQYVREPRIENLLLKEWLLKEWRRTGLPQKKANEVCGVKDVATRKYFDQGHLWYYPPPEMFQKLQEYANLHGKPEGRSYFSLDGKLPMTGDDWKKFRSKFRCPHGYTNVWNRPALRGQERIRVGNGKAVHLNQKPLDLVSLIIEATTEPGDVVWEPFGGLFTACAAAYGLKRKAYGGEIDPVYFSYGVSRLEELASQRPRLRE